MDQRDEQQQPQTDPESGLNFRGFVGDMVKSQSEVLRTIPGPTQREVDAMSDELDYINYRDARDAGEHEDSIAAYFGARRDALEKRYQDELAARKSTR